MQSTKGTTLDSPYNYVVSAQRPTAVTHALKAFFSSEEAPNLVLAKTSQLEVHEMTPEGLVLDMPVTLNCSIVDLVKIPDQRSHRDMLFILTERFQFCLLRMERGNIKTDASGSLALQSVRKSSFQRVFVDPKFKVIAIHIYDSVLQIIPLTRSMPEAQAYSLRIEELEIFDMCFLNGFDDPTLAVLFEDPVTQERKLKLYRVDLKKKDLVEVGAWGLDKRDRPSHMIPLQDPLKGVIVLGGTSVVYLKDFNQDTVRPSQAIQEVRWAAWGRLDDFRFLVADTEGALSALILTHQGREVTGLSLSPVGEVSTPSSITYLDENRVYIGSAQGDSQLIELAETPTQRFEDGKLLRVETTHENLGPIVDMTVVDLQRQGEGMLVTCSGSFKDGSLRVITNGMRVEENCAMEMVGIEGIWSLRDSYVSNNETSLVAAFVGETRVLGFEEVEGESTMSEITNESGLDSQAKTLFCANVAHDLIVQVTPFTVRLIACASRQQVAEWKPNDAQITLAHANATQILLALSGHFLVLLKIVFSAEGASLVEECKQQLGAEPACVNISPAPLPSEEGSGFTLTDGVPLPMEQSRLAVVGLWDFTVRLFRLPTLQQLVVDPYEPKEIPRSVLLSRFGRTTYVLCGLGDGQLLTWKLADSAEGGLTLAHKRRVTIGTKPVVLFPLSVKQFAMVAPDVNMGTGEEEKALEEAEEVVGCTTKVFACCDRPNVIHTSSQSSPRGNDALIFSNVNLKDIASAAGFDCAACPESIWFSTADRLVLARMENERKLHVRKIPMNEHVRRIAHQPQSETFGVVSIAKTCNGSGEGEENKMAEEQHTSFVRLLDQNTFEVLHSYELQPLEMGCSILSTSFTLYPPLDRPPTVVDNPEVKENPPEHKEAEMKGQPDPDSYFVVGTAFTLATEPEPQKGRILVFAVVEKELQLRAELETRGAVYSLAALEGMLVSGVNSTLLLLRWTPTAEGTKLQRRLEPLCEHHGHILALFLKVHGESILLGDLMKSVTLLSYHASKQLIMELARDYQPYWTTAVHILAPNLFMASEHCMNLFCVRRKTSALNEEERSRLEMCGRYHLGDFVNTFRPGSLVMRSEEEDAVIPTALFGTISGAIGVVARLNEGQFKFFSKLQDAMRTLPSPGGLKHKAWRAFHDEKTEDEDSLNFIDGDLIESFLFLEEQQMNQVVAVMGSACKNSLSFLQHRVEEMRRIH